MGHIKHFLVLAALFGTTLFGFQNCSSPISEDEEISSIAANAPWAFDVQVDSIAHMSCGQMANGYDRDAYFSFAAGAFRSGAGLKYTDNYIRHTGGVSPSKRQQILEESSLNSSAELQIAVRSITNLNQILSANGGVVDGFAFGNFVAPLSDAQVALALPQQLGTARTRDFGGLGPLLVMNDLLQSTTSQDSRNQLNTNLSSPTAILTTAFGNSNAPTGVVRPSPNAAYGRGFGLGFSRALHLNSGDSTVLSSVTEINLEGGAAPNTEWTCNHRFLIVDPDDEASGGQASGCDPNMAPGVEASPANGAQAEALATLRQFVPNSKWAVDLNNNCIIKRPGVAGDCNNNVNPIYSSLNGNSCSGNNCPHYLSICQRN